ncbi:MAG TPA: hypothetical protein VL574_00515 [Stellaceae bacterium]|jgi:hypothetical protein|nr:hypothetical protein [Stellaceae bacterium]
MVRHHRYRFILAAALLAALGGLGRPAPARADDGATAYDSLDDTDRSFRQQALQEILVAPVEARRHWSNIDSGHDGTFKVVGDKADARGRVCRTVAETLHNGGGQAAEGTIVACRTPVANHWQIARSSMTQYAPVPADLVPGNGIDLSGPAPADMPTAEGGQPQIQVWIDGENYRGGGQRPPRSGNGPNSGGLNRATN